MRALAVLGVKNEGAFLLEWLAHHRATGFTDFLVFSNDCTDGTDLMLDRLAAMGWLTHIRNDGPHDQGPHGKGPRDRGPRDKGPRDKGPQWAALKAADSHPLTHRADWILFLDIDEFVNIHLAGRTLPALLAALPGATAITLTWRLFGNAGVIDTADQPVTETFTKAAPATFGWPWRAQLFKTLFRNDGSFRKLGVHRPRSPDPARAAAQAWFDGAGRPLPAGFHAGQIFSDYTRDNYALVQMNHYALGTMQNYLLKCDRGRANREASTFDMSYWVERNFNAVEDRSILALNSRDLRDGLHADPVLRPLHKAAVQWRHARFAALMAEEPWRALFGRLLMTPGSHTLTAEQAQRILAHRSPGMPAQKP